MPESEIVRRINAQIGVIAPTTAAMCLRATATEHDRFTLAEIVEGIGSKSSGVADRGKYSGARG